jgi:hypothetical protein
MPPLIMHAVIILCALSIKHKYPANRCARIYLLVSMRQVVRENTRWNLLHPGVLWCTCLASMSQPAASPHVVETVPAERVHHPSPEVDARLIHISMQMRRCKFKLIGNWAASALLAGKRRRTLSESGICVSDARRAAVDGLLLLLLADAISLFHLWVVRAASTGIFHIYSVYHMLLSRATTNGAGDWRVFIIFFCNSICLLLKMRLCQWCQFSTDYSG